MHRWIAFILLTGIMLAVAGTACTDDQRDQIESIPTAADEEGVPTASFDAFQAAINEGASCARLYELRNELDPRDPNLELMNDELLRIGCLSASDVRTDGDRPVGTEGLEPINYNSAYTICSSDPEETYRQSGTDDPEEAANWLAEASRLGVARDSSYQGCLDGLLGEPNRFD